MGTSNVPTQKIGRSGDRVRKKIGRSGDRVRTRNLCLLPSIDPTGSMEVKMNIT
jgi:hypothetical protein